MICGAKSFKVDVAERRGMNDPRASCASGSWLRLEVEFVFDNMITGPSDMREEVDSRDDVRVRGRDSVGCNNSFPFERVG